MNLHPDAQADSSTELQPGQPAGQSTPAAKPAAASITPEMHAELEAAMKELQEAAPPKSAPVVRQPAIRGPRVVQAGREHRTGKVVAVGDADIFIEFGPKELGILPKIQFPNAEDVPKKDQEVEVVIDRFEP